MQYISKHKRLTYTLLGVFAFLSVVYSYKPQHAVNLLVNDFQFFTLNTQQLANLLFLHIQQSIDRLPKILESLFSLNAVLHLVFRFALSAVMVSGIIMLVQKFDFSPKLDKGAGVAFVYNALKIDTKVLPAQTSQIDILNTVKLNA